MSKPRFFVKNSLASYLWYFGINIGLNHPGIVFRFIFGIWQEET